MNLFQTFYNRIVVLFWQIYKLEIWDGRGVVKYKYVFLSFFVYILFKNVCKGLP